MNNISIIITCLNILITITTVFISMKIIKLHKTISNRVEESEIELLRESFIIKYKYILSVPLKEIISDNLKQDSNGNYDISEINYYANSLTNMIFLNPEEYGIDSNDIHLFTLTDFKYIIECIIEDSDYIDDILDELYGSEEFYDDSLVQIDFEEKNEYNI